MKQRLLLVVLALVLSLGAVGLTADNVDAGPRYSGTWTSDVGYTEGSWYCQNYTYHYPVYHQRYWYVYEWRPYSGYAWHYDHAHTWYTQYVDTGIQCETYYA